MLPYAVESLSLEAYRGPLHRRLYQSLRDAILEGSLAPETRLPASRILAAHLGVSRNTVVSAFDQLQAEGYVTARVGQGTRVAAIVPENLIACAPVPPSASPPPEAEPPAPRPPASRAAPFEPGQPDTRSFPHVLWARLLARNARHAERMAVPYAEPMGAADLRAAIARHVREYRGVRCAAGQVLVTTSTQAGLAILARALLAPGDTVWLEEPGYPGAVQAFREVRAELVPVPVDAEGMDVEAAPAGAPPRLIYVTPSHQFPLGAGMPLSRRLALLERAARADAYVLEDDYDSEFRFSGRPVAALQGLDNAGRVIYMGTFSKTLMPGMRVGYLVLPEALAGRLDTWNFLLSALQPPSVVQAALAQFMAEGHYAAHIRRMRTIYARRLEALEKAAEGLPAGAHLARCSTGLQVPLFLPPGVDDRNVAAQGREAGLWLNPLSRFYLGQDVRHGLLLGFASVPEEDMSGHMNTLDTLIRTEITRKPGRTPGDTCTEPDSA